MLVGLVLFNACFQSSFGKPGTPPSWGLHPITSSWAFPIGICQGLLCSDALIRHVLQKFRTGKRGGGKPLLVNLLEMKRTSFRLGKWIKVA